MKRVVLLKKEASCRGNGGIGMRVIRPEGCPGPERHDRRMLSPWERPRA